MAFIVEAKCINNHIYYLESQSANVVIITREMAALKLRRENTVSVFASSVSIWQESFTPNRLICLLCATTQVPKESLYLSASVP